MRTTLTFDDDVAALLVRVQKKRGLRLKELVNQALREGLLRLEKDPRPTGTYRMKATDLGSCLIGNLDCVGDTLAIIEGESYK